MVLHDGEEDMLPDGVVVDDLDGDSYSITWTTDNSTVLNLTIVANDPSKENVSSMFTLTVQLCACENGGNCTTNGLLNTDSTFVVLNCECPAGMYVTHPVITGAVTYVTHPVITGAVTCSM